MSGATSHRRRNRRRVTGAATAAVVAVGLVSLAPTAQGQDRPVSTGDQEARVHREAGRPLLTRVADTPAGTVRDFLRSRGASAETLRSLRAEGRTWKTRGVTHLRMEQRVAGLRVHDTYARAAFNAGGKLVDLVENVARVPQRAPVTASVGVADALRAAVDSLYPGRLVDTDVVGRWGNVTTFAQGGFYTGPRVERVAVPTDDGGLAVGFLVETWTGDENELRETLVSGDGAVVESVLRTAVHSYNIFPEAPTTTPQQVVQGPDGWLDDGVQYSTDISGNNAHAYLDTDDNNRPDPSSSDERVTDGDFLTQANLGVTPASEDNQKVAVQNLFYLNNLIHDTLYTAGFTEQAGNFQEDNSVNGGHGGDPVAAEAQDGGGTDNANFATPRDGRDPRMQMYLWHGFGTHEVVVGNQVFKGAGAEWAPQLTTAGVAGDLAAANDASAATSGETTTDACQALVSDVTDYYKGKVVVADRGACTFVTKAQNVQNAGGVGIVVANNIDGQPFTMGGTSRTLSIPGVMLSKADGQTLRTLINQSAQMRLTDPPPLMRDGDLDSDIVWHEYGHGLTWRMIGRMDGPLAGAIGEGMSDILALIANEDDVVGEYSASDPLGIRSAPYTDYSRTYADVAGTGVHFDGEVYAAIGWELLQRYQAAGLGKDRLLADLVDGMNYTPEKPSYELMRDGILAGLAVRGDVPTTGGSNPACMVADAFAKFGVGEGAQGVARGSRVAVTESFRSACGGDFTPVP